MKSHYDNNTNCGLRGKLLKAVVNSITGASKMRERRSHQDYKKYTGTTMASHFDKIICGLRGKVLKAVVNSITGAYKMQERSSHQDR